MPIFTVTESIFAQTDTVLILCNKNFEIILQTVPVKTFFLQVKVKLLIKNFIFSLITSNKFMTSLSNHLTGVYLINCMIAQLEINITRSQSKVLLIILKLLFVRNFSIPV